MSPSYYRLLEYVYYEIGVNIFPTSSRNKIPEIKWAKYQNESISEEQFKTWKDKGNFDKGFGFITGWIWRGPYQGKNLVIIDIDNSSGIQELLSHFTEVKNLDELATKTLVVQHQDAKDEKAHIYFITEKSISKRSGSSLRKINQNDNEVPIIEVKSDNSTYMVGPGSIHHKGHPYTIVGTKEIKVLNKEQSDKLESTLNDIYKKFDNASNNSCSSNKSLNSINDLFSDTFCVPEGNNRQEYILRVMDSLIKRNHEILSEQQVRDLAYDMNLKHCVPPLDDNEFENKWHEAKKFIFKNTKDKHNNDLAKYGKLIKNEEKNITDVEQILDIIQQRCEEIFVDQFHDPYVSIKINNHHETLPLESKKFENIILSEHFKSTKSLLSKDRLSQIIDLIKANADLNPKIVERNLNLRVAKTQISATDLDIDNKKYDDVCYYYDLTNSNWEVIKVTRKGWNIVSNTQNPIFKRYKNSMSQSYPNRDYSSVCIEKVLNLFNLHSQKDRLLFLVYVVSLFIPDIAKPILLLYGSKGSAKTTSFELVKNIVDPSIVETSSFPKDVNDLIQILSHSYVTYFDNITTISQSLSDLLCRVVTGSSYSKRTIYTVDDAFIYKIKRPIGINGINIASARPDFLDRCLIIEVNRISKEKRRKEEDVKNELKELIPDILGWVFDTLVKVLNYKYKNSDKIRLKEYPRMADFAEYGEIISRCIGYKDNEFIQVYFENIETQNDEVVESSIVAKVIIEFMEDQTEWEGSATHLHSLLTSYLESKDTRLARSKAWPNAANSLSRKLNELAPTLKEKGIDITHKYNNNKKGRTIFLTNIEKISSLSSYRSSGDSESDKTDNETTVFDLVNSVNIEKEGLESELGEKALKHDNLILEAGQNTEKDNNKVINIYQIAGRIHEHSDIWMCKRCDHKGDKWDLLKHYPYCKNNKK